MRKIPSLFKRDYEGNRLVYDEIVEGSEWALEGEGVATEKFDGTACAIIKGVFYKRYDVKKKRQPPKGSIACDAEPNEHTGHWPHWALVTEKPENQWHRVAFDRDLPDGTYELVGPKVQGNPYKLPDHRLWLHGNSIIAMEISLNSFEQIRDFLSKTPMEGIVWHHPDKRMCKIKRRDFGLPWPPKKEGDDWIEYSGVRFKPVDEKTAEALHLQPNEGELLMVHPDDWKCVLAGETELTPQRAKSFLIRDITIEDDDGHEPSTSSTK